jgi:GT2 family glycosyltransferase
MRPETSVVILNWNGARLLPACLSALARQSYRDYELLLVDNGSIDGSDRLLDDLEYTTQPAWLEAPLPRPALIIRNMYNRGFAAGNNQALDVAQGRYIVTLNNDAIAEPRWLAELVSTVEQAGPHVGMVASTMLFGHLPDVVASAGISVHRDGVALDRAAGLPCARLAGMGTRPVFGPSAGAALYRAELLEDVGRFDERFFSYLEDADLAWRARSRGWKAVHNPHARVRHEYSATGGHNSPFKRRLLSRNHIWLVYKNMPECLLRRSWRAILTYDLLALCTGLLRRDRHMVRGRLEALARLGEFTTDRRKITTSARLHPDEVYAMLAPALTPRQTLRYRARIDRLLATQPQPA